MILIQRPNEKINFSRLDDRTWSYQRTPGLDVPNPKYALPEIDEVRIETPEFSMPGQAYDLAIIVARALQAKKLFLQIQKSKTVPCEIQNHPGSLNGKWLLTFESPKSRGKGMFDWIPFIKKYPPHHFVVIHVSPFDHGPVSSFAHKIKGLVADKKFFPLDGRLSYVPIHCALNAKEPFTDRLKKEGFSDPFTRLSTEALQSVETNYVSENSIQGSCRLVVGGDGQLKVDLIGIHRDPIENQRTVRMYRDFLIDEYGQDHVDYVQVAYGINFKQMIERGLSLLPDHVYKVNVGCNNIEMSHLESLYQRLSLLRADLAAHPVPRSIAEVLEYYHRGDAPVRFCMRELRKLMIVAGDDVEDDVSLKAFLDRLIGDVIPDHLPHLMPEQFNALIAMLWPTDEELSRSLTGRQINHLAICGYKTMGKSDEPDPSRDQAELMQIFPKLEKCEDWDGFFELLSHVVVKKNLFRKHLLPDSQFVWRMGAIIPAPMTKDLQKRWYCVCKVSDNSEGNLSYVLLSAAKGFRKDDRPLPMIYLYRSTNSNRNSIDSMGSIENDLNPTSSPGALGEMSTNAMKGGFVFNRTIPLWVAMMLYGDCQSGSEAIHFYREALIEFEKSMAKNGQYCSLEKSAKISQLKNSNKASEIREFICSEAEKLKEHPKFKRGQDIIFMGHSLGGALCQSALHFFGPHARRIPCPGYHFICRSYNGPATDTKVDHEFIEYGRNYREVIRGLGQNWKIFHQFEYGDFIPEAGGSHLGTNNFHEEYDEEWLEVHIQNFQPLEGAHALPITTCPTHGRRIGGAAKNFDYRLTFLSPEELFAFDHAWWLSKKLNQKFGYRILVSPRITEIMRRGIGSVVVPFVHIGTKVAHCLYSEEVLRNAAGIFSCEYRAQKLQPEQQKVVVS